MGLFRRRKATSRGAKKGHGAAEAMVARVDVPQGYSGSYTVAGVAECGSDEVYRFLASPEDYPNVFDSIKGVKMLSKREARSLSGQQLQMLYIVSAAAQVLGRHFATSMKFRHVADSRAKQTQFAMLGFNPLFARMEGANVAIPLKGSLKGEKDLQKAVDEAVEAWLAAQAAGEAPQGGRALPMLSLALPPLPWASATAAAANPVAAASSAWDGLLNSGLGQNLMVGRQKQRCIVIMHQRVKLRFGQTLISRVLRGFMLRSNERNLNQLLTRYSGMRPML